MKTSLCGILLLLVTGAGLYSQAGESLTRGYGNGTLIAIGGGRLSDEIYEAFRKYAGGDDARIVVIPTASDDESLSGDPEFQRIRESWEKRGFNDVTVLHTRNPEEASSEEFIRPIREADGIFFTGGRQWRIADGFLGTLAQEEMFRLLDRGGVIAGTSAGATIQGSYLARGDTRNNQVMMGDHEEGLGFISNIAIDQHVLARNRQFDLYEIVRNKPGILGIGLDESTAMVVRGDTMEVIGAGYVLVYDGGFWSREGSDLKKLPEPEELFYFLRPGDRYNLAKREVIE